MPFYSEMKSVYMSGAMFPKKYDMYDVYVYLTVIAENSLIISDNAMI